MTTLVRFQRLAWVTALLSLPCSALATSYTNPMGDIGAVHNLCVDDFGAPRGGWSTLADWEPVSIEEIHAASVQCAFQHGVGQGMTPEQLAQMFPVQELQSLDAGDTPPSSPAAQALFEALEGVLYDQVEAIVVHGVPQDQALDELAAQLAVLEQQHTVILPPGERDAAFAGLAVAFESFAYWTDPTRLDAVLEAIGDSCNLQTMKGKGKGVAKVIAADAKGAVTGAKVGGALSGGNPVATGVGAAVGGVGNSIVKALELNKKKKKKKVESEDGGGTGGDDEDDEDTIGPDDDCPDDGFPNPGP